MQLEPHSSIVNPFYHSRVSTPQPTLAKIPAAPKNASPVPHLTSLYHGDEAGDYPR